MLKLSGFQNSNHPSPYRKAKFPFVSSHDRIYSDYIIRNLFEFSGLWNPTVSVSFGWWFAPQETSFQRFLLALMAGKTPLKHVFDYALSVDLTYAYCFPINSLQNLHISHTISQILSSSPHVHSTQNAFPSLAFHKKRLLWKLRGYMTGQQGRQRAATKHSLYGCHVDHQGLFHPETIQFCGGCLKRSTTISNMVSKSP